MSSIITTEVVEDTSYAGTRKKRKTTELSVVKQENPITKFFNTLNVKKMVDSHKFTKVWLDRNIHYAEVFSTSIELEKLTFQQYVFVEDTKELATKLDRIGFVEQIGYPDEIHFKKFSRMMYNAEYNIALSLYKPQYKKAIMVANEVVETAGINGQVGLNVFLSTINVLISKD